MEWVIILVGLLAFGLGIVVGKVLDPIPDPEKQQVHVVPHPEGFYVRVTIHKGLDQTGRSPWKFCRGRIRVWMRQDYDPLWATMYAMHMASGTRVSMEKGFGHAR